MNMFDLEYVEFASKGGVARNSRMPGYISKQEQAERREQMRRAKEAAMASGKVVKVGINEALKKGVEVEMRRNEDGKLVGRSVPGQGIELEVTTNSAGLFVAREVVKVGEVTPDVAFADIKDIVAELLTHEPSLYELGDIDQWLYEKGLEPTRKNIAAAIEAVVTQPVEEPDRKFINKLHVAVAGQDMTDQEFVGICNLYKQLKAEDEEYTWRDAVDDYVNSIPF